MKKIIFGFFLVMVMQLPAAADTHKMFDEFQQDITSVRKQLSAKKISLDQASVLLLGIIARQNQVLIYQNNKLSKRLSNKNEHQAKGKH